MASFHFYTRLWRRGRGNNTKVWKVVAITFIALLFLVAITLAIVHIARRGSSRRPQKRNMAEHNNAVLKYFDLEDGIKIKWAHAVNSQMKLTEALNDKSIHILEADVILDPLKKVPIMAHPPLNTSDVTLDQWLSKVIMHRYKGMKLDFKELQAVEPSLQMLESYAKNKTLPPVLLNADILPGPNSPTAKPLNGTEFIYLCTKYFKHSTLSPGWTTRYVNAENDGYSPTMVADMYDLVKDVKQPVTFPVRASLVYRSKTELLWLMMQRDDFTLTVWTSQDDNYDVFELKFLRDYPAKVFYDLPDIEVKRLYEP